MIAADLMRALAVGTMGVLALSGRLELWHMLVLSRSVRRRNGVLRPGVRRDRPRLVPDAELNQANSLDQLVRPAALRMLGPALGGLIVAIDGPGTAFVVDACTFLFSISCVALMRARHATPDRASDGSAIDDIREGFAFVRSQVWLWGTFLAATLGYLIFWGPSEVLLPFVVRNDLHGSAADLGLIFAVGGIGAMTCRHRDGQPADAAPQHDLHLRRLDDLDARDRRLRSRALPVAGHGRVLRVQRARGRGDDRLGDDQGTPGPGRLLGRVSSFDWFISIALVPLSYAFTGPDRRGAGRQETLVGAGLLGGVVTLAFLFLPGMRDIERSGVLAGTPIEPTEDTGFGALEGPLAPISAGQAAISRSGNFRTGSKVSRSAHRYLMQ